MKHQLNIKFSIKYVYIGLICIIISGLVIFYMLWKREIPFGLLEIVAYITGTTTTLTLMYHAFNLEYQIKNQMSNNQILKSKYTYDIIAKWNEVPMTQSATDTIALAKDPERMKELSDPSRVKEFFEFINKKENADKRRDLLLVLNYFETVAIMVEKDHIDSNIIKSAFRTLFVRYYNEFKYYIYHRQTTSPRSWCTYEGLVKKWIEKSKELA